MSNSSRTNSYPAINITNNSSESIILLKRIKPQDQSTADPEAFMPNFQLLDITCKSQANIIYTPTDKQEDILIAIAGNQRLCPIDCVNSHKL